MEEKGPSSKKPVLSAALAAQLLHDHGKINLSEPYILHLQNGLYTHEVHCTHGAGMQWFVVLF